MTKGQPHNTRLEASLALDESLERLKGLSHARAAQLAKLGLFSIRDLVHHIPRRYLDLTQMTDLAHAQIGESQAFVATIFEVVAKQPRPSLSLLEVTLTDGTGTLIATFFHQSWLKNKLAAGMRLLVYGRIEFNYGFKRVVNPYFEVLDEQAVLVERMLPIHPLTAGISAAQMRKFVALALEYIQGVLDPLPVSLRQHYHLASYYNALKMLHFPRSQAELNEAKKRLIYEEVFLLELELIGSRTRELKGKKATVHNCQGDHLNAFMVSLPFELSEEQLCACSDIFQSLSAEVPARHLLLGDVGCGKTLVAACALCTAADSGVQAFMVAPTEVLAHQYALKLGAQLDQAGVSWAFVSGSTPAAERRMISEQLSKGSISVLFGTQVLLEDDFAPKDLSLVVIDEEQRFGVAQRDKLLNKGRGVHLLSLTATPIPRSMALALYGDMQISLIKHRPYKSAPVTTKVLDYTAQDQAYTAIQQALTRGEQAYVICPLVGQKRPKPEEGEQADETLEYAVVEIDSESLPVEAPLASAKDHAQFLANKVFPQARVGLLHGQMKSEEKTQVTNAFYAHELDILVSTTVVEVGVDVPNATVMVIEDADRFGLSQLHQLRGRVGRSDKAAQVFLLSSTRQELSQRRLKLMERMDSGFDLAEADLNLRREGDLLGIRQHGASLLKLVNVIRDRPAIEAAYRDASQLIAEDPDLTAPEHKLLARHLRQFLARTKHES